MGEGSLPRALLLVFGPVRTRPDFGLFLAGVALVPLKWLSPLSQLSERAGWADVFFAAAFAAWGIGWARGRSRFPRPQPWHWALGAFLGFTVLSAAVASAGSSSRWTNVLITAELIGVAFMTADFAAERSRRRAIVLVVAASAAATVALAAVALALFYAGVHTSLLGAYGDLTPSDRYVRVEGGFHSQALLASWCIFASALVASDDASLSDRTRRALQGALALTALSTLSRGVLGLITAAAIRQGARFPAWRIVAVAVTVGCIGLIGALTVGRLHLDPSRPQSVSYEVSDPGSRREAFETSLETLEQHPVFGTGPGSLPGRYRGEPFRAHFTPLNVAATVGIPALAALIIAIALLWRRRMRPTDVAVWSGLAGLAIDGLAQDIDHFRHVWILIGFAAALQIQAARDTPASDGRPLFAVQRERT